jgi:hypothetical protein
MLKNSVDTLDKDDLRIQALLGFFHGFYGNIIEKLNLDLDTFILNLSITDYIKRLQEQNPRDMKLDINKISLFDIFTTFRATVEHPDTFEFQLMYLFGFTQGLLNRIMRKLEIDYQIPPPI